ncbi:hypothetical protein BZZ01_04875 [Nostocales cyanobacterium HT-58-2]|nr:hypothetical protein BZZ01_04875 [Nostocales cyanobacterium HT-58-2]
MLAFLIEAYGKGGLVPYLVENYSAQFLNDLLEQTVELRRDPKEREEEIQREEAQKWLEENKGQQLLFRGDNGEEEMINVDDFSWVE